MLCEKIVFVFIGFLFLNLIRIRMMFSLMFSRGVSRFFLTS